MSGKTSTYCTVLLSFSATNPCKVNNGGCSHLCLLAIISLKSHTCRCPNGMNMSADGVTCTGQPITGQPTPGPSPTGSTETTPTTTVVSTANTTPGPTKPNGSVIKTSKSPATVTVQTPKPPTNESGSRPHSPSATSRPSEPGIVARRTGKDTHSTVLDYTFHSKNIFAIKISDKNDDLRKCQSKLDCLIFEMLFIKELKLKLANRMSQTGQNYLFSQFTLQF